MPCPPAVIFDLDDTLAESFHAPPKETLEGLKKLLEKIPVAIMTGAGLPRMEQQFLPTLVESSHSDRLYIFPNSAAQLYVWNTGTWREVYGHSLTGEERERIKATILETVTELPAFKDILHFGQQMFDREAQIAYTHLGVDASADVKRTWDPDGSKRGALWQSLKRKLPEFEVLIGGTTTIDITRKDVNKSYGVTWLAKELGLEPKDMLYVGDALYAGGNDAVVISTGIQTRAVSGPAETKEVIDELISICAV